jgi:hypothetical protein
MRPTISLVIMMNVCFTLRNISSSRSETIRIVHEYAATEIAHHQRQCSHTCHQQKKVLIAFSSYYLSNNTFTLIVMFVFIL